MQEKMSTRTGYIKPTAEDLELIERWRYPDVEDERVSKKTVETTNALGMAPGEWRQPEPEEEEEVPQPPTAEEIEEIRRAAFDDGFAEGKEAGHAEGREEGLKQGFEEGHTQGLEQGCQEGLAQGQAIIDEKAMALDALIRQLHTPLENVDQEVEASLVKLAANLAEEVIRTELKTNPDVILQVLHEAISVLPLNTGAITIDLHPEDLLLVQQQYDENMLQDRGWHLRGEPALTRGDVSITSERSYVDISMKQRVKDLMERFLHQSVPRVNPTPEQISEQQVENSEQVASSDGAAAQDVTSQPITDSDDLQGEQLQEPPADDDAKQ